MPTRPAKTADDITDSVRSFIDELARRGQDVAELLADRGADVGSKANEAWRDTTPVRRDAAKRLTRATNDAAKWSDKTWRKSLRPMLKDAWKRRTIALGAAGAAVPAGREIVDTAAVRLGIKQREERHWGAFFLGLLLGAAAGAIVAMLTTPKRGSEMRRELGAKADDIAAKAKEADWVPIFQRDEGTNGRPAVGEALPGETLTGNDFEASAANLQEGAAEAGAATGEAADQAAADTAEAINDSYDGVDRESPA
jgi:gas vesicle protein